MNPKLKAVLKTLATTDLMTALAAAKVLARRLSGKDKAIVQRYLSQHEVAKLHIGSGKNTHDDWLNADISPKKDNVMRLDARDPFPFEDGTFDYIFSEHMIEHIPYASGIAMLQECHRILKAGGKVRISTPDLAFLVDLYRSDKTELQEQYVRWGVDTFVKDAPDHEDTFVINNFVRAWGHLFIYDDKTLRAALQRIGFTDIRRFDLNQSNDDALQNMENQHRLPPGFLALESFTLEATKA